ncbi:MAG: hypothetical protein AAEA78_01735, partial [Methylophilaceae bacterium]
MANFLTTAFYHFVRLNEYEKLQPIIQDFCNEHSIKGTILLASEGINGTISAKKEMIKAFHLFIKTDKR